MQKLTMSYSKEGIKYRGHLPEVSIEELFDKIVLGDSIQHIYNIGVIRGMCMSDPYNRAVLKHKCSLPFVYITGIRHKHEMDSPLFLNGFLHIDLDFKLDASKIGVEILRNSISKDQYSKMVFITPSGRGLKIIVETDNTDIDKYNNYLLSYFEYLHKTYAIAREYMDMLTPHHIAFISYDNEAKFQRHSKVFTVNQEIKKSIIKQYTSNIGSGNYGL